MSVGDGVSVTVVQEHDRRCHMAAARRGRRTRPSRAHTCNGVKVIAEPIKKIAAVATTSGEASTNFLRPKI